MKLTKKQQQLYNFIKNNTKLSPPTYKEIANHFKITNQAIFDHIKALKKKGHLNDNRLPNSKIKDR